MSTPVTTVTAANRVVRFGVGGTLSWASATAGTTPGAAYQIVSAQYRDAFTEVEAEASGNIFANAAKNPMAELSVEAIVYLDGAGKAQSDLIAAENLPTPLGKITISNANATINGDWNYGGVSNPYVNGQWGQVTFTLHRKGQSAGLPAFMPAVS